MFQPWMSKIEIDMIKKYLDKSYVMLEYGCGGSTLFFSHHVKEYYSVEHNQQWYNKIAPLVPKNVHITHIAQNHDTPNQKRILASDWKSLDTSSRSIDFKDYIEYPKSLCVKFDTVLIDGRARPECAKFIVPHLKENATVFIHDYCERIPYHVVETHYQVVDSIRSGQTLAVLKLK